MVFKITKYYFFTFQVNIYIFNFQFAQSLKQNVQTNKNAFFKPTLGVNYIIYIIVFNLLWPQLLLKVVK